MRAGGMRAWCCCTLRVLLAVARQGMAATLPPPLLQIERREKAVADAKAEAARAELLKAAGSK